jgi:hypothetical protein
MLLHSFGRYLSATPIRRSTEHSSTVVRTVSQYSTVSKSIEASDQMKRFIILIILVALSAGQVLRVPSSYQDGVKWQFGTDSHREFHSDLLTRSNVDQDSAVPTVYKKELVAPIARREPVIAVYKKPPVIPDVYEKYVVPTVYRTEPIVQNVHKQQSAVPAVFRAYHSVASNIYKSEPVVHNVYKQQAVVPIVHKTYPAVPNVYQFKNQPVQPVVHYQQEPLPLQNFVPKDLPLDSQKKVYNSWNYQYNPHEFVHGNVHLVPHN